MSKCKQPYIFVPVVTKDIKTHKGTFHDGDGNGEKITGIMKCSLTVKTPMIVGHFQYVAKDIKEHGGHNGIHHNNIIDKPAKHIVLPEEWGSCGYKQNINGLDKFIVDKEKSILEPLFLNGENTKPVLISGTSLKGMIRQSIGAITNSPMERVAEKQFSYRPGLVYQSERDNSDYKLLEARANGSLEYQIIDGEYIGEIQKLEITLPDGTTKTLSEEMIASYWKSINTYDNKKTIPNINENDPVFVEYDEWLKEILSFGNHQLYRWTYADTTTKIQDNNGDHKTRGQTAPHEDEKVDDTQCQLTAVRSLMGYVDGGEQDNADSVNLGIGDGKDYARLAGRISINTAVEVLKEGGNLSTRFVKMNDTHNIPLKILAQPKANAVECYLDQSDANGNILNTYGDFPILKSENTELAGRKFYHRAKHTLNDDFSLSQKSGDAIALAGKQSTIARYISKENTEFKFTVRFKDLSDAELGVLICALSPAMAANENNGHQQYWQQLGHGRPLGMGSIDIKIDSIKKLSNELEWQELSAEHYIQEFMSSDLIDTDRYNDWLEICKPLEKVKPYMTTAEHSGLRMAHLKAVRNI